MALDSPLSVLITLLHALSLQAAKMYLDRAEIARLDGENALSGLEITIGSEIVVY